MDDKIERVFEELAAWRRAADCGKLEDLDSMRGEDRGLIDALYKARPGRLYIRKMRANAERYKGYTYFFGVGISPYIALPTIDRYFVTSVIQSIDWEQHTIETINSTYIFEFEPMSSAEADAAIRQALADGAAKADEQYEQFLRNIKTLENNGFAFGCFEF